MATTLAPVTDDENLVWERVIAAGITIKMIGGNCPVQAEGSFDDQTFYFRARYSYWQFHVGPEDDWFTGREWLLEGEFGTDYEAGWMCRHEALDIIVDSVAAYRAMVALATSDVLVPLDDKGAQ